MILSILSILLIIADYFVFVVHSALYDVLMADSWEEVTQMEIYPVMVALVAAHILLAVLTVINELLSYIISAIPIYIMAYNSGHNHPWLSFIPYGKTYLSLVLPMQEYSYLGLFKTINRQVPFWVYFGLDFFEGIAAVILGLFPIRLVSTFLQLFYKWGKKLIHFSEYRDLLRTFGLKKHATWIAIVGLFWPLIYWVALFIVCRNEPDFGFGRYYIPVFPGEE